MPKPQYEFTPEGFRQKFFTPYQRKQRLKDLKNMIEGSEERQKSLQQKIDYEDRLIASFKKESIALQAFVDSPENVVTPKEERPQKPARKRKQKSFQQRVNK